MLNMEEAKIWKRNENGYPLNDDGTIDWGQTSIEKYAILDACNIEENGPKKSRNPMTHLHPKKKKRKK